MLSIWLIKYKLYNTKIIPLETRICKVSNNILFVIYTLYYVVQINNLELRVGPLNRNGGSMHDMSHVRYTSRIKMLIMHIAFLQLHTQS
jgi:hypothetical protein